MSTYICSDIHGFYDRYIKMLNEIKFNDDDTLYILGDVIDRGNDGIKTLQDIMMRSNVKMFLGNHEFMMLNYIRKSRILGDYDDVWLRENNGGIKTLEKFKVLPRNEQDEILSYLENKTYLQKVINTDNRNYMLCHTCYSKQYEELKMCDADMHLANSIVWHSPFRDDSLNAPMSHYSKKYIFIVGHVPTIKFGMQAPLVYENIINIDGGCAASAFNKDIGDLCCIRLEGLLTDPYVINIK